MPYCYWHTRFNGGVYVTSKSMINIHVMLIKSLTYSRQGPARHSTCTLTLHLKTSSHLFTPGDIFYNCGHPLFDNYKIRCYITRKKKTIKCLFALQFKKNLPLNIFIWYNKKKLWPERRFLDKFSFLIQHMVVSVLVLFLLLLLEVVVVVVLVIVAAAQTLFPSFLPSLNEPWWGWRRQRRHRSNGHTENWL